MKGIRKFTYKVLNRLIHSNGFGNVELYKQLLRHLPDTPLNYVDVGAYDGDFFDVICKEKKIGNAILIEPQEDLYQKLVSKYKDRKWVELFPNLLSDHEGEFSFFVQEMKATSSILKMDEKIIGDDLNTHQNNELRLKATTLDLILKNKLDTIDLLKIDVQGAELLVLKGGANILARTKRIWIEVSFLPLYRESAVFGDIHNFLYEKNFKLVTLLEGYTKRDGELLQADCLYENKMQ